jgi:DNA-binding MarR family transcriptional regulator
MWQDFDLREGERERPEPGRGESTSSQMEFADASEELRDVFSRSLDVPRGSTRERVRVDAYEYKLSGDEVRALAAVGAFRVVPAKELWDSNLRTPTRPARALERLREHGLIRTVPHVVGRTRTTLVALTERGRAVLEGRRRSLSGESRQAFYAGISKPRELAHDARLHSAYVRAAEKLAGRGATIRRVVLEEELKAQYQRFLQKNNRGRPDGGGLPERDRDAIARWAREHELPYHDGHVEFPDARIEYDDRDGRRSVENIEVVTPHYRGAHAAAKARAGFGQYRAVGARVGGIGGSGRSGRSIDPRLAEELLP